MAVTESGTRRRRIATLALTAAFVVGACQAAPGATPTPGGQTGAPGGPTPTAGGESPAPEVYNLHMRMTPSNVAWVAAQEEGLFEGINLDWELVGYGESAQLFLAGEDPVGQESPWEAAAFQSQGDDIVYFGTPSALNFLNGVVIRAADKDKYKTLEDMKGQKFGIPGFGTGSYAGFEIIGEAIYGMDTRRDLQIVEASPGALLGLLETGEIEGMINFTGQTALALTQPDKYHMIVNFSDLWFERYGARLVINGPMARREWLDANQDVARRLVEGVDRANEWLKQNPDTLRPGGKYAHIVEGEGWHATPETTEFIIKEFQAGNYYFSADMYTQEWIEGVYEFIKLGEGIFADEIPPIDRIFYLPLLQE